MTHHHLTLLLSCLCKRNHAWRKGEKIQLALTSEKLSEQEHRKRKCATVQVPTCTLKSCSLFQKQACSDIISLSQAGIQIRFGQVLIFFFFCNRRTGSIGKNALLCPAILAAVACIAHPLLHRRSRRNGHSMTQKKSPPSFKKPSTLRTHALGPGRVIPPAVQQERGRRRSF